MRAAGTWAALSTGETGKAHLPGLPLRGPPFAIQCQLGSQNQRARHLQGQRDGTAQHREHQAALVSLLRSVCGWLGTRRCCLFIVQAQPCILGEHLAKAFHVLFRNPFAVIRSPRGRGMGRGAGRDGRSDRVGERLGERQIGQDAADRRGGRETGDRSSSSWASSSDPEWAPSQAAAEDELQDGWAAWGDVLEDPASTEPKQAIGAGDIGPADEPSTDSLMKQADEASAMGVSSSSSSSSSSASEVSLQARPEPKPRAGAEPKVRVRPPAELAQRGAASTARRFSAAPPARGAASTGVPSSSGWSTSGSGGQPFFDGSQISCLDARASASRTTHCCTEESALLHRSVCPVSTCHMICNCLSRELRACTAGCLLAGCCCHTMGLKKAHLNVR